MPSFGLLNGNQPIGEVEVDGQLLPVPLNYVWFRFFQSLFTAIGSGNLTFGTLSAQNADNVAITGGHIENTEIGLIVPAAAAFTTINGLVLTPPATGATFTLADGKTFVVNESLTFDGLDGTTITFQGTDTYVGRATVDSLSNKSIDTAGGNVLAIAGRSLTATTGTGGTVVMSAAAALTGAVTAQSLTVSVAFAVAGAGSTFVVSPGAAVGSLDRVAIGVTTPAAGAFTTLSGSALAKVMAQNASVQSIPGATNTTIVGWTTVFDANGDFNAATGVFTAPATAYYQFSAGLLIDGTFALGGSLVLEVVVNAAIVAQGGCFPDSTTVASHFGSVSVLIHLTVGQTALLRVFQSGTAKTLNTAALNNYISFAQLP